MIDDSTRAGRSAAATLADRPAAGPPRCTRRDAHQSGPERVTLSPTRPPGTAGGGGGYDHLTPLLVELAALAAATPRHRDLRAQLIVAYQPVAAHLAARYRGRGQPIEDLEQVAIVGLIKALDRFDPTRGVPFLSYLVPTANGEILRYFRDHTWALRPPRGLTDLLGVINRATDSLTYALGRTPRPEEIAAHVGATVDDVVAALQAAQAHHAVSFDLLEAAQAPYGATSDRADTRLDHAEIQAALRGVLARLPERERRILALRFVADLTQTQIGEAVGLSQMQISRILIATLAGLRTALQTPAPPRGRSPSARPGERRPLASPKTAADEGKESKVLVGNTSTARECHVRQIAAAVHEQEARQVPQREARDQEIQEIRRRECPVGSIPPR